MDAKEIETLVGELETRVDRLRSLYEQYFMGIERVAPSVPHKDVERRVYVLRKEQIRNTAVRFRFQMLIQRYNTYQTHWQRVCRQIEEGTYKRDLLRAQRRLAPPPRSVDDLASEAPPSSRQPAPSSQQAPPSSVPLAAAAENLQLDDFGDLDRIVNAPTSPGVAPKLSPLGPPRPLWRKKEVVAPAPAAAPVPPPLPKKEPAKPPPLPQRKSQPPPLPQRPPPVPIVTPRRSPADLSDDRLRQIYSQYVQTRRTQNESTATLSYDEVAKSLRESSAKLREKHGKSVDFEVAVKEGKTVLRPVVKR